MVRKACKEDIGRIMELFKLRPDLFKPYTTKYDEQELEAVLADTNCPIFVYDDGQVQKTGMETIL